jgi:hypothetical protein
MVVGSSGLKLAKLPSMNLHFAVGCNPWQVLAGELLAFP